MRAFLIIILYLGGSLLLAGIAAPWIGAGLSYILPGVSEYHVLVRSAMLIALACFPWLLCILGINDRVSLGLNLQAGGFIRRIAQGILIGVAMLIPLIGALFALDVLAPAAAQARSLSMAVRALLAGLLAGLMVALIEEIFFRGAVFSAIVRYRSLLIATVLSSLLYASLHFINPKQVFNASTGMSWYGGLEILAVSFKPFLTPSVWIDSFLALFAAGVFLCLVRIRSGNLAVCMGIHAGWVTTIKLTHQLTYTHRTAHYSYLVGHYDGIIGYLAFAWLILVGSAYYWLASRYRGASAR